VIDKTPPDTFIRNHPDATSLVDSANFSFGSNERGVHFACRMDGGPYGACRSPSSYSNLADGSHTFRVAAIDRAGNGDPTPAEFTFQVRTVPSAASITSGPRQGAVSSPRPSFGFDAQYAVRFQCRYDGRPFAPCSASNSDTPPVPLTVGTHTFEVRGIGGTGTPGPSTTRSFVVSR
jgi:hypothetical protein